MSPQSPVVSNSFAQPLFFNDLESVEEYWPGIVWNAPQADAFIMMHGGSGFLGRTLQMCPLHYILWEGWSCH